MVFICFRLFFLKTYETHMRVRTIEEHMFFHMEVKQYLQNNFEWKNIILFLVENHLINLHVYEAFIM